jgi:hypothetical protein
MYVPNKIWSNVLRLAAIVCFSQGILIITESFLKPKIIKQICIAKEKDFSERTEHYSYRLNFKTGHQYVDSDVYNAIMIGDSVLFRCTPLHYTIFEFIFPGNIKIKNVENYYAQIGFGVFFLIMGGVLLFFKFKKKEHLIIWSFLIGAVLIFVITDFSNVLKGNPYGYSQEINFENESEITDYFQYTDTALSLREDSIMIKIMKNEIKTPMDSVMSKKCFDYLKTNYSLMNKILNDPISLNKEAAQVAMANYLICMNSIELLEKSKMVLTIDVKNELETYKNRIELVSPRIFDLYKSIQ